MDLIEVNAYVRNKEVKMNAMNASLGSNMNVNVCQLAAAPARRISVILAATERTGYDKIVEQSMSLFESRFKC